MNKVTLILAGYIAMINLMFCKLKRKW